MKSTFDFAGYHCRIRWDRYATDGSPAIVVEDAEEGGRLFVATVWSAAAEPGEVAIKNYSENAGMVATLVAAGVIEPTPLRHTLNGYVSVPIHRLTPAAAAAARSIPA